MRLNWSQAVDITIDKFTETLPADALDRAKYAEYLTNFLVGKGQINDEKPDGSHYVLNLNAEWGAGKSYFLKRWAEDLKQHYPVVYIDAWQQDYSDDPLLTAVSAMINQLRKQAGKDADKTIFKAPRKMLGLLKAAAPAAIAGIVKRYAGFDFQEVMQAADKGENLGLVEDTHNSNQTLDMSKAASAMVQSLLDDHDAKTQAIAALKHQVRQWVEAVVGKHANTSHQKDYPAFILVDELDRCRPSYAVEMLETIKHIFDIPGVVFVVATDTEQLQHTVKALYGEGFDARAYLGRFFNSRYTLKTPSLEKLLSVHPEVHKLSQEYLEGEGIISWPDLAYPSKKEHHPDQVNLQNLVVVFKAFQLNARLALQITERLISVVESLQSNDRINLIYLAFMICLNEKFPQYFEAASKHRFDDKTIELGTHQNLTTIFNEQLPSFNDKLIEISQTNGVNTIDGYPSSSTPMRLNFLGTLREIVTPVHSFLWSLNRNASITSDQHIKSLSNQRSRSDFATSSLTFRLLVEAFASEKNCFPDALNKYVDWVELSCSLDSGDAE